VESTAHRQIEDQAGRLSTEVETQRAALAAAEAKLLAAAAADRDSAEGRTAKLDAKLEARTKELSGALESANKALGGDLQSLRQKVDVDVSAKLTDLDADVNRRLTDLKGLVEDKVQTSIATMSSQLEEMKSRVQTDMEPKLAEAALAANRANNSVAELKTRVQLDSEELTTGFRKGLSDLAESVGLMEDSVRETRDSMSDVEQMAEINSLLIGAAAASPH
jgi:hypothetical protein